METPSGATTDTTTDGADASTSAAPGAESPPAAKGTGENGRIDELTGNWRETQRDRDYWRSRAIDAERRSEPGRQQANGSEANDDKGAGTGSEGDEDVKTLADFKYDEKAYGRYIRQLARQEASAEAAKLRGEIKGEQTAEQRRAAVGEFQEKATSWAKEQKLEDFALMFASPAEGGPIVSDDMAEVIMTSEHGAAILHYLTKNKAENRRIAAMSPVLQAREIGRLEAKFAAAPTPPPVSGAPPPHEKVKGASDKGSTKDPAQMTDSEWYADQQRRQRAARK